MAEGDVQEDKAQDKTKPGIKVTDRRHFTPDGQRRGDVEFEPDAPAAAPADATAGARGARPAADPGPEFTR